MRTRSPSDREVEHLVRRLRVTKSWGLLLACLLAAQVRADPNPAAVPQPSGSGRRRRRRSARISMMAVRCSSSFPNSSFATRRPGNWPVPAISAADLAHGVSPVVISGNVHPLSGGPAKLTDGSGAQTEDDPSNCFFFDNGVPLGRFRVSLARAESIGQINLYSWHRHAVSGGMRAPLKVDVYASSGDTPGFNVDDPHSPGYVLLAHINTIRPGGVNAQSGQHGASVFPVEGQTLGHFQHFLFEVFPPVDGLTHTFITEVDIVPPPARRPRGDHAGRQTVRRADRGAAGAELPQLPQPDRRKGWARFDACRNGRRRGRQRGGIGAGQTGGESAAGACDGGRNAAETPARRKRKGFAARVDRGRRHLGQQPNRPLPLSAARGAPATTGGR